MNECIGFSKFISMGNKTDIDEVDLIKAIENDANTKVVLVYLEGVKNGAEFINAAKKITKNKTDDCRKIRGHHGRRKGCIITYRNAGRALKTHLMRHSNNQGFSVRRRSKNFLTTPGYSVFNSYPGATHSIDNKCRRARHYRCGCGRAVEIENGVIFQRYHQYPSVFFTGYGKCV